MDIVEIALLDVRHGKKEKIYVVSTLINLYHHQKHVK